MPCPSTIWYLIKTIYDHVGAIAQLGERLPCTQEVCGSIPHSSTTSSCFIDDVTNMIEALDKLHYLSKAFFNEKVCSLTIRKADKCSYLSHKNNGLLCLYDELIGVIDINEIVLND